MANKSYILWSVAVIALFGVLKLFAPLVPYGNDIAAIIAVSFQLYVPLWQGYQFAWPSDWRRDLLRLITISIVTFVPYVIFYIYMSPHFAWRMPSNLIEIILLNFLIVALPEEIFYRGFLQPKLGIILVNVVFALAHWVGEYDLVRLLPFFPGLVFSYLTYRSKSITSAVIYHALCNILSEILFASSL